jgi:hypothetical protein
MSKTTIRKMDGSRNWKSGSKDREREGRKARTEGRERDRSITLIHPTLCPLNLLHANTNDPRVNLTMIATLEVEI